MRSSVAIIALTLITAALGPLDGLPNDAQAAIRNRYSFSIPAGAAPQGTVITDSVGGANGVVLGNGAVGNGTSLQLPGGPNGSGAPYVDLPNGLVSSIAGDASFEAWYTISNTVGTWQRIFDFGDSQNGPIFVEINSATQIPFGSAGDTFFWAPMQDRNTNLQRFSFENDDTIGAGITSSGSNTINTNVTQPINVQHHVVVTYQHDADGAGPNSNSRETVFIDGLQAGTVLNSNAANFHLSNIDDVNNWLGRSNYQGDGNLAGSLNEFRIYNNLLDANQVAQDLYLGPDNFGEMLSLDVNNYDGRVTIINHQAIPIVIDNYKLTSAGNQLSISGWNSLDDQEGGDPVGSGWDEVGGSNAGQLSELYLAPSGYSIPPNGSLYLGHAYNPAVAGTGHNGDLVFQFGGPAGYSLPGSVKYNSIIFEPSGPGDYNHDGFINAADYTVYRNRKSGIGGTTLDANVEGGITSGIVDIQDYNFWRSRYQATSGSGAASGNGNNVPEPATRLSLAIGVLAAAFPAKRRRRESATALRAVSVSHIIAVAAKQQRRITS